MPCYHPWRHYPEGRASIVLSCGRCDGCKLERSRQWAVRCMHEASLHERNCFVTLTYNEANLPVDGSLCYPHFQRFMRDLRKRIAPVRVRFFMCGEYGERYARPHFHACVFGYDFSDKVLFKRSGSGSDIFTSKFLSSLWKFGFSSVGAVTFQSAAYVARYVMKKAYGEDAVLRYSTIDFESGEMRDRVPEFCHMSLKPGIGSDWFFQFWPEVIDGYVVVNGVRATAPRFYVRMLKKMGMHESLEFDRLHAVREPGGLKPGRLRAKEDVARARINILKREL